METKNNIKKLRESAGMTVSELSRQSGVSRRTIQNWEADPASKEYRRPRDVYQLHSVAVALGVSIEDLIQWEDTKV